MKTLSAIVLCVVFLFSPSILYAEDSILTCTFEEVATFYTDKTEINAELSTERNPNPVIFAGLDSDSPVMKGNMGEAQLSVLMRNSEAIWLAETPPLGGVNVWTIFPKKRVAIQTKQYSMIGHPFGLLSMGRCR